MANKSDGAGFDWSTMWSIFRTLPDDMKKAWMFGVHRQVGLSFYLKDAMENYDKSVQDEMLEHAPIEVQKHFGYVSKESKAAQAGKKKPAYNENYRSPLLDKIRGLA
jgi:hypothetical protein